MHSGFITLRNDMSMELLARLPGPPISDTLETDIRRIVAIWHDARSRFGKGGEFLFGAFSNADAMFVPVATRFRSYGVDLSRFGDDGRAQAYAETLLALPAMAEWTEGAKEEVRARASSPA
jgi:glutathione S-transferase